ncbi:MAG: aspartate/glutamate racemase family protein [Solirubrobacterales bacterium]|nr:aspartate/glutamate racemase family protein [Solirubrobacterales bacterium]
MSTRIGLIVPSSNTVIEVDFYRRLPPRCTLHTARMYLEQTTPEGESVMLDEHLPRATSDLATARPDVTVFGCTSAGALRGNAYEAKLVDEIQSQTGSATFSVAASVRWAIRAAGCRRVGVITPYVDSLNEKIAESLQDDGLEVAGIHGLGITENFAIAEVEPERIAQFAAECFAGSDIELLFASCTNFRAFDAREQIHQAVGLPVVTSNQAALAAVLDHLGAPAAV